MRVLFISDTSATQSGGIETHIQRLSAALSEEKKNDVDHLLAEHIRSFKFVGKSIVSKSRLKKEIQARNPDVLHIHGFASFFVALAIKVGAELQLPIVFTPHYHPFSTLRMPFLGSMFFHVLLKSQLTKVHHLIALTREEEAFFQQYVPDERIHIVPNGIDLHEYDAAPASRDGKQMLFVGRNVPNKRIDFLLAQESFFKAQGLKVVLVSDVEVPSGEVFSTRTQIPFDELKQLYRQSGALLLPSKYEAFGIVVLEALASGLPVVISDRVQIKEYLQDEAAVFVYDYDDTASFQAQMLDLLSRQKTLQFPDLSNYDWKAVGQKLNTIYLRG